uniref:DNA binding protein n=1 Tax=Dulem virus 116 TaxID=3145593 RepID=A0AAU8AXZ3_9VIRU
MANRKPTPKSTDKKIFRRTASKAKKININPKIFRGGIRL